jgi:UDP-glucose-4-epimerase GalE
VSTVLVTGGAGYIGSHAVKGLALAGFDVVAYDDLSAGHREAIERVAKGVPSRAIALVEGGIGDRARVADTLKRFGVTAVMHFAAKLSVGESMRAPIDYYATNVAGTLGVLAAMADSGVKTFVFSSTAATFGEPMTSPIDESHPQDPINPYGASKLAIERILPFIERAHGIKSIVLRYFNAAGADPDGWIGEDHSPEEHLIPRAIAAASGGEPLVVFGNDYPTPDGTCLRDFVHVTDLADAHVLALRSLIAGGASGAFNLGNGQGASVTEMIAAVERVTKKAVAHKIGPRRSGDPAALVASSERAKSTLGWRPKYAALDTIVSTAWAWHRANPHGYAGVIKGRA